MPTKPVSIKNTREKKKERKADQKKRELATDKIKAAAKNTLKSFDKNPKPDPKPSKDPLGTRIPTLAEKKRTGTQSKHLGTRMVKKAQVAQSKADAEDSGGQHIPRGESTLDRVKRNFKDLNEKANPKKIKERRAEFKEQSKMDPRTADLLDMEIKKAGPSVVLSEELASDPKENKAKSLIKKVAQATGFFPKDGQSTKDYLAQAITGFGEGFQKGFQIGGATSEAGSSILSGLAAAGLGAHGAIEGNKGREVASRELDIKQQEATRKSVAATAKANLDANKLFEVAKEGDEGARPFNTAGLPPEVAKRFSKEGGGTGFLKTKVSEMAQLRAILVEETQKHNRATEGSTNRRLAENERSALAGEAQKAGERADKATEALVRAQQRETDLNRKIAKDESDRLDSQRDFNLESEKIVEAKRKNAASEKSDKAKFLSDQKLDLRAQQSREDNNTRLAIQPQLSDVQAEITNLQKNYDPVPSSLLRKKAELGSQMAMVSRTSPVMVFQEKGAKSKFLGISIPFTGEARKEYTIDRPRDLPNHAVLGQVDPDRASRLSSLRNAMDRYGSNVDPVIWHEYKDILLYFAGSPLTTQQKANVKKAQKAKKEQ